LGLPNLQFSQGLSQLNICKWAVFCFFLDFLFTVQKFFFTKPKKRVGYFDKNWISLKLLMVT
jgi:hypothetical protein